MPYYNPYPIYPIYSPPAYYVPIPSTPLIHQTPGWNPLQGHDAGSAPPGVATRIVASAAVPNMAIPMSWAAPALPLPLASALPLHMPRAGSPGACKCNRGVDTAADPEPRPSKPKTDGKTTLGKTPDSTSSSASPSSSCTISKTKAMGEPGSSSDILGDANKDENKDKDKDTNANANADSAS